MDSHTCVVLPEWTHSETQDIAPSLTDDVMFDFNSIVIYEIPVSSDQ